MNFSLMTLMRHKNSPNYSVVQTVTGMIAKYEHLIYFFVGHATVMQEALVYCSVITPQDCVHARLMLKEISARDARMEHTIVTRTILMAVLLVSALIELMSALLQEAL